MNRKLIITFSLSALLCWQCTKESNDNNLSLKESINKSTAELNAAVAKISNSNSLRLMTVSDLDIKSEMTDGFRDTINLELIAGIYDFKPTNLKPYNHYFPLRLFEKTASSSKMIVNLPEKLVFHPRYLHFCNNADSVLKNNFTITANDYHFYYTMWNNSDYLLDADFTLDSKPVGKLSMFSLWKSWSESGFSTTFTFPEGYSVIKSGTTGDTVKNVFAFTKDKDTLMMETNLFTGEGFKRRERQYILSIGNVDIKKSTGVDSIQVFLNGVLQKKSGAKIIDTADFNSSICYKRDILLTFDDGTTSKLSELISPARETLRTLMKSLGEMYFSKHIIDYIAFSIYYNDK